MPSGNYKGDIVAEELTTSVSQTTSQFIFYVKNLGYRLKVTEFAISEFRILIYTNYDNKITSVNAFGTMWEYTSNSITIN